ncbi:hypothetical protein KKF81_06870 [Candidatus Micrarchaeota archaeon]|nr:hypothetical protein [Candidatus Micrarchaeota archaeon]MBU1166652.1 hypothetical protein [Candidatus Micrarchaeota archaeon]MBU1886609.1 hypothetical protein [Candidatus Micrarchaeota archaeon]
MAQICDQIESYVVYKEGALEVPFMHLKQNQNGIFIRFVEQSQSDMKSKMKITQLHYTRHTDGNYWFRWDVDGKREKHGAEKRTPLQKVDGLERIATLVLTDSTMKRPIDEKKKLRKTLIIDSTFYSKGMVDMVIYLNPNRPLKEVLEITKPEQYAQDYLFAPPILILCFRHHPDFLKLKPSMF